MSARPRRRTVPTSRTRAAGFTLIEIILATVLLALGLTIAFASLHSANASVQRAEIAAARNEHLRAVQGFLYRMLQGAQPLVLAREDRQVTYFVGAHDQVRFVASMPGYLSRGGPYALQLKLVPSAAGDGTQRLQFSYAMLVKEKPLDDDGKLPPEDLLDGIAQAHFEYRALGSDSRIGAWQDTWERPTELPLEIRLQLRFADATRPWPAFTTALPLGFARAQAANAGVGILQPVQPPLPPPPLPSAQGGGK
jgi:general secretion pathway protein J